RYAMGDEGRQTRPSAKSPIAAAGERSGRGALPTKGARSYSAPRIQKAPADLHDPRRGATRRPADSDTPSGPASSPEPNLGPSTRQPPPMRHRAPTPPMRDKLDTTDFTGENSIVCHACGSIIAANAETCVHCGAMTGFVIKE